MNNKRFTGKAGEEYELFKLPVPHFDALQNTLGKIIKEQFQDKEVDSIEVLEIGCGPGYTTMVILDSDIRTRIVAVDNESVMIKQAQEVLSDFINNGRVKLIEADALEYLEEQQVDSFDVFISGYTLHNFSNHYRERVIKEIHRILKSGGVFLNADKYALDNESEHKKTLNWQLQQFKDKYSKINRIDLVDEWISHYLEDDKPEVIMKELKSIQFMNGIGFKDIKIAFRKQMDAVLFARK